MRFFQKAYGARLNFLTEIMRFIRSPMGITLIVLFVAWQVWLHFSPRPPDLDRSRKMAVDSVLVELAPDLEEIAPGSLLVLSFPGDETGYAEDRLREILRGRDYFSLADRSLLSEAVRYLGFADDAVFSRAEAIKLGANAKVDYVLIGRIKMLQSGKVEGKAEIEYELVGVKATPPVLLQDTIAWPEEKWVVGLTFSKRAWSYWVGRILVWLLGASVVITLMSYWAYRRVRNTRNLKCIPAVRLIYTPLMAVWAYMVIRGGMDDIWNLLFVALAIVASWAISGMMLKSIPRPRKLDEDGIGE